jgi:REP element-mobilizing transposase RayT
MVEALYLTRNRYEFLLLSFVVMPDHLHCIVVPRSGDTISRVVRFIKGTSARMLNASRGVKGPVWQPRFYDRAIRDEDALRNAIEYIESNPVKAGLAEAPTDYLYSSANQRWPPDLDCYFTSTH